jgi:hypothetical protein
MAGNLRTGMFCGGRSGAAAAGSALVLVTLLVVPAGRVRGQNCCGPSGTAGACSHTAAPARARPLSTPPPGTSMDRAAQRDRQPPPPPHGGQMSETRWHHFEVVYLPREARIYVYTPSRTPLYPRGARGEVTMRMISNDGHFRGPVTYLTDEKGRGYLSVAVDVSRVRDGDMTVDFVLQRLPLHEEPEARFTQTFALTRPPVTVQQVALTEADRPLIARQQNCPVRGTPLGQHGAPLKLLIDGNPVFVCCNGCIDQLEKHPQSHVAGQGALRR